MEFLIQKQFSHHIRLFDKCYLKIYKQKVIWSSSLGIMNVKCKNALFIWYIHTVFSHTNEQLDI